MELFEIGFVTITLIDILDISVVTFLFYKLYESLKGNLAIRVASAVISIFVTWKIVDLLGFRLLGSILDQFLGLGAIAIVVIFAPEIRRFLEIISKNTLLERLIRQVTVSNSAAGHEAEDLEHTFHEVVEAMKSLRASGHGALIVITGKDPLREVRDSGDEVDAKVSARMIYTIFQKESPLHDGAMLMSNNRITSVRCILPISKRTNLDPELGLRHRSALGISEISDALVIVVSEERRELSMAQNGQLQRRVDYHEVDDAIREHFLRALS
ncbi:MAG: diadenylate cyclase CdaA [Bacteroidota bacterium]